MRRFDIEDENLFWSFGIFALVFIVLLFLFVLYILFRFLRKKIEALHYVEDYLMKKLFFSAIIRYMIESYLKVFHNSLFFFYLTRSTTFGTGQVVFSIALIAVFSIWPLFVYIFLHCFRNRLDDVKF